MLTFPSRRRRRGSSSAMSLLSRSRVRRLLLLQPPLRKQAVAAILVWSSLPSAAIPQLRGHRLYSSQSCCRPSLVRWISLHAPIAAAAGPGLVCPCFYLEDKKDWMMTDWNDFGVWSEIIELSGRRRCREEVLQKQ
ncbi:hypothetical protein LINPERPRIM_LOCUS30566 [Linum perenne]